MSLPEVANLNEISSYHQQKLAELRKMPRTTIRHIFRSVSAPRLEEIEGEYYCELLHQGGPIADWFIKRTVCFFSNN